jgi:Bacterial PH domain
MERDIHRHGTWPLSSNVQPQRKRNMTFRSKVDTWLLLVVLASAFTALAGASLALRSGAGWFPTLLIALIGSALPIWILVSTKYTVSQAHVLIQSGPFRWCIAVPSITRIASTRSPVSSPALSLDRLRIEYDGGKKALMVSPLEREQFVQAVKAAMSAAEPFAGARDLQRHGT